MVVHCKTASLEEEELCREVVPVCGSPIPITRVEGRRCLGH